MASLLISLFRVLSTLKRVRPISVVNGLLKCLLKPLERNASAEYTEKRERK